MLPENMYFYLILISITENIQWKHVIAFLANNVSIFQHFCLGTFEARAPRMNDPPDKGDSGSSVVKFTDKDIGKARSRCYFTSHW